jgi:hypothetical protein
MQHIFCGMHNSFLEKPRSRSHIKNIQNGDFWIHKETTLHDKD